MNISANIPIWIGQDSSIQWIKTQLKEIADTDLPVLITGEFGTGKRLSALTIHALSSRREQPFTEINCAAIHELQIDDMLFTEKEGKFNQADKGILFLDEIDFLPIKAQIKLESMLKQQRKEQIKDINLSSDVRILAATQCDLDKMVKAGNFHAELYYRLNVVNVRLPALRTHKNDIPDMVFHFANQCAMFMGKEPPEIEEEAIIKLCQHDWPGNVWELKRLIERAVILAIDGKITFKHIERLLNRDCEFRSKISRDYFVKN